MLRTSPCSQMGSATGQRASNPSRTRRRSGPGRASSAPRTPDNPSGFRPHTDGADPGRSGHAQLSQKVLEQSRSLHDVCRIRIPRSGAAFPSNARGSGPSQYYSQANCQNGPPSYAQEPNGWCCSIPPAYPGKNSCGYTMNHAHNTLKAFYSANNEDRHACKVRHGTRGRELVNPL